jgi:hypothetical protein
VSEGAITENGTSTSATATLTQLTSPAPLWFIIMNFPIRIIDGIHGDGVPGRGRYVVATRKIKMGETVFECNEDGLYGFVITEENAQTVCWRCFARMDKGQKSNGKRWFCSKECLELDDEKVLGELFSMLQQTASREKQLVHKRHSRSQRQRATNNKTERMEQLSKQMDKVDLDEQVDLDEDLPLDFIENSNWEPPIPKPSLPIPKIAQNDECKIFSLDAEPSEFEKSTIRQGLALFDAPTSDILEDLALDDDEIDQARYIVNILWKRSLESPEEQSLPDLSQASVPKWANVMQLQACERVYHVVTLRRRSAVSMDEVLLAQSINLAKGVRSPKYPTKTTPFYISPELERHLKVYHLLRRVPGCDVLLGTDSCLFRAVVYRDIGNCFGVWEYLQSGSDLIGTALYPLASFFNHSCEPNLERVQQGRGISFNALKDISEGQEVCISYGESLPDVLDRKAYMRMNYFFDCSCPRCTRELLVKS